MILASVSARPCGIQQIDVTMMPGSHRSAPILTIYEVLFTYVEKLQSAASFGTKRSLRVQEAEKCNNAAKCLNAEYIPVLVEFTVAFILFYMWHMLGITVGYHRLLSHRSFQCPKFVEYFWVLAGYLAFEGSPIWWVTIHRCHHRYTDQPRDPHSPRNGIKHAYNGWMKGPTYPEYMNPNTQTRDLMSDPVYKWLEQGGNWSKGYKLAAIIGIVFRLLLLVCFGWTIALASITSGLIAQRVPIFLNILCHIPKLGYKNYETGDDSVNIWWVALFTMGEGWHNNHHADQGSAKSGIRTFEFDPAWLVIVAMHKVGLVQKVNGFAHGAAMRRMKTVTRETGRRHGKFRQIIRR